MKASASADAFFTRWRKGDGGKQAKKEAHPVTWKMVL
jgi:hypothetical protein